MILQFLKDNFNKIVFIVPLIILVIIIIVFKCTEGKVIEGATDANLNPDIFNFEQKKDNLQEQKRNLENDLYLLNMKKHKLKTQLQLSNVRLNNLKDSNTKILNRKKQLQNDCFETSNKYKNQIDNIREMTTKESRLLATDFLNAYKKAQNN